MVGCCLAKTAHLPQAKMSQTFQKQQAKCSQLEQQPVDLVHDQVDVQEQYFEQVELKTEESIQKMYRV